MQIIQSLLLVLCGALVAHGAKQADFGAGYYRCALKEEKLMAKSCDVMGEEDAIAESNMTNMLSKRVPVVYIVPTPSIGANSSIKLEAVGNQTLCDGAGCGDDGHFEHQDDEQVVQTDHDDSSADEQTEHQSEYELAEPAQPEPDFLVNDEQVVQTNHDDSSADEETENELESFWSSLEGLGDLENVFSEMENGFDDDEFQEIPADSDYQPEDPNDSANADSANDESDFTPSSLPKVSTTWYNLNENCRSQTSECMSICESWERSTRTTRDFCTRMTILPEDERKIIRPALYMSLLWQNKKYVDECQLRAEQDYTLAVECQWGPRRQEFRDEIKKLFHPKWDCAEGMKNPPGYECLKTWQL